ncbi:MAG TPA: hypothetical protein VMV89_07800, partial [Candidatus Paceibacterota bacterium]|nr:hypothetical protein [Candidatus Paceibacterota bacterium]
KQRERVVIIDPAGDPEAVKPNSGKSQRDFIIQPRVGPSRSGEELPWVNRSKPFPTLKGLYYHSRR